MKTPDVAIPTRRIEMHYRLMLSLTGIAAVLLISAPLSAATKSPTESEELLRAEGCQALNSGDIDKAQKKFTEILDSDPSDMEAHFELGAIFFRKAQYSRAIEHLSPVVNSSTSSPTARLYLGIALYRLGLIEDAAGHLKILDETSPNGIARLYLGLILEKRGERAQALEMLKKAVQADPNLGSIESYAGAVALLQEGKGAEAMNAFKKVASSDPSTPIGRTSATITAKPKTPKKERPVSAYVAVEEVFDSNVILQSTNNSLPLPGGVSDEKDERSQIYGGVSYKPVNTDGFSLALGFRFYEGFNAHLHQYDFHQQSAGLELEYKKDRYAVSLPYNFTYSYVSTSYSGYSFAHTLAPSLLVWENSKAAFKFTYQPRYEGYFDKIPQPWWNRSAWTHKAELVQYYRPVRELIMGFGYVYQFNDAVGPAWRYQSNGAEILLYTRPVEWFKLDFALNYMFRDFDSPLSDPNSVYTDSTAGLRPRKDNQVEIDIQMVFYVYRDLLGLAVAYTGQFNRSNEADDVFNWNRHLVGISFRVEY